ncbi:hypothetical protein PIB30_011420 [Stylosanthes scabra]|uniref:HMA domain-containing protein n=1 Tax=Stylosanthes scabra TaxID=79078 RepID=A0ABU6Q5W6_9FABA|nr:hypothetical protein [Stylosanthes scabra]
MDSGETEGAKGSSCTHMPRELPAKDKDKDASNDNNKKKKEESPTSTTLIFNIDMHCDGCTNKINRYLRRFQALKLNVVVNGVESAKKESGVGKLIVEPSKLRDKLKLTNKNNKNVDLVSSSLKPNKSKDNNKKPKEKELLDLNQNLKEVRSGEQDDDVKPGATISGSATDQIPKTHHVEHAFSMKDRMCCLLIPIDNHHRSSFTNTHDKTTTQPDLRHFRLDNDLISKIMKNDPSIMERFFEKVVLRPPGRVGLFIAMTLTTTNQSETTRMRSITTTIQILVL